MPAAPLDTPPPPKRHQQQQPTHWAICCGGSGLRGLCHALMEVAAQRQHDGNCCGIEPMDSGGDDMPLRLSFVVAMSDDGGSSRAIMDAVGGLAVGDCRNLALTLVESMLSALERSNRIGPSVAHRRALHIAMGHRLCSVDDAAARRELMDAVLPQLRAWEEEATSTTSARCNAHPHGGVNKDTWSIGHASAAARSALKAFLAAVLPHADGNDEGTSHHHHHRRGAGFTFRNASVGNMVLMGRLLTLLGHDAVIPTSPMHQAVHWLMHDVFCMNALQAELGVAVDVIPSMDYYDDDDTADCPDAADADVACMHARPDGFERCVPTAQLPRVALIAVYADGTEVVGQRAISYGRLQRTPHPCVGVEGVVVAEGGAAVGAPVDDDDVLVTVKSCASPHQVRAHYDCRGTTTTAPPPPQCVSRLYIRQLPVHPMSRALSSRRPLKIAPSRRLTVLRAPHVVSVDLPNGPAPPSVRWILARGSLFTSTLAAALSVPALSSSAGHDKQDVVLMVNGWQDKETMHVATLDDVVAAVVSVLPGCHVAELWLPRCNDAAQLDMRGPDQLAQEPGQFGDAAAWPAGPPPPMVRLQYFGSAPNGEECGSAVFNDAAIAAYMMGCTPAASTTR